MSDRTDLPTTATAYGRMASPETTTTAERVARAWDPVGWAWYDSAEDDHPAKSAFLADQMKRANAVLEALADSPTIEEAFLRICESLGLQASPMAHLDAQRLRADNIRMCEALSEVANRSGIDRGAEWARARAKEGLGDND